MTASPIPKRTARRVFFLEVTDEKRHDEQCCDRRGDPQQVWRSARAGQRRLGERPQHKAVRRRQRDRQLPIRPGFLLPFQLALQAVIPGGIQRIIRLGDVASLHVSREGICFVFAPGSLEQCLQLLRTVLAGVDLSDVAHEDFPPVFIYIAYQRFPGDSKHLSA